MIFLCVHLRTLYIIQYYSNNYTVIIIYFYLQIRRKRVQTNGSTFLSLFITSFKSYKYQKIFIVIGYKCHIIIKGV